MSLGQIIIIVIAVWVALLALGPLVEVTSDLTGAMAVAGLVGWIAARIVPGRFRRYQPRPRRDTPIFQGSPAPAEWTHRRSLHMAARTTITNLALLLVSFLLGIFLCELALRYFYPKYQHAAESQYSYDAIRIWSRNENNRSTMVHPDTGSHHPYYHNNLGMRQHRDFSEGNIESAINIGFFGDSFVENIRIASQYSFTEPLDYLLSLSQKRFNVLNLGVDSYGTGQSFLRYENFRYAENLSYVFYVYIPNDLRNIYETNLFHLDVVGELVRNEAIQSSWWIRIVSGLHIPYLLLDVGQQLPFVARKILAREHLGVEYRERFHSPTADGIERDFAEGQLNNEDVKKARSTFQQLIRLWKELVEKNGGNFYILPLPIVNGVFSHSALQSMIASIPTIPGDEIEVINLYECFNDYAEDYYQREWRYPPYRFKKDGHWNEAGNQLAAVCLYRFLEQEIGLPVLSDEALREAFFTYYSSFAGWIPDERWIKEMPVPSHVQEGIRNKYLALERQDARTD